MPYRPKLTVMGSFFDQIGKDLQSLKRGRHAVKHSTAVKGSVIKGREVPGTVYALGIGNGTSADAFTSFDEAHSVARALADKYKVPVKIVNKRTKTVEKQVGRVVEGKFKSNPSDARYKVMASAPGSYPRAVKSGLTKGEALRHARSHARATGATVRVEHMRANPTTLAKRATKGKPRGHKVGCRCVVCARGSLTLPRTKHPRATETIMVSNPTRVIELFYLTGGGAKVYAGSTTRARSLIEAKTRYAHANGVDISRVTAAYKHR